MTGLARRTLAALALASGLALGGCAYDDGYGYGGVSVGTGYYGGYGGGYYDPYWGPANYPGGYGWYDGFYYPGNGYYVYDRGGRRHRWSDGQRRYWEGRRGREWRDRGRNWDRDGRPDWRGNDGRPGNWARPRPGDGRDRNGWRGNDGDRGNWARPRPQQPDGRGEWRGQGRGEWRGGQGREMTRPVPQRQPGVEQARPQRDWGARPSPRPQVDRQMRSGNGRGPAPWVRPD